MQISEDTINILKNFASINPSIRLQKGNVIKTCSIASNVMAVSAVNDSFPRECHIYDLNQFLGMMSFFENPNIDFKDKLLTVSERGKKDTPQKLRLMYTDENNIVFPPDKDLPVTNPIKFNISEEQYTKIINSAPMLKVSNIVVRGKNGILSVVSTDANNPTSNEFGFEINKTEHEFEFVFKAENFKFVPGDYKAQISHETNTAYFKGTIAEYWIAVEANSYFNE